MNEIMITDLSKEGGNGVWVNDVKVECGQIYYNDLIGRGVSVCASKIPMLPFEQRRWRQRNGMTGVALKTGRRNEVPIEQDSSLLDIPKEQGPPARCRYSGRYLVLVVKTLRFDALT